MMREGPAHQPGGGALTYGCGGVVRVGKHLLIMIDCQAPPHPLDNVAPRGILLGMTSTPVPAFKPVDSITVEPMTQVLRQLAGLETDPNHLAVVHRTAVGYFQAVLHTTDDIHDAYAIGRLKAGRLGATVLTRSTYAPTVVGADIAAQVIVDPLTQPLSRL